MNRRNWIKAGIGLSAAAMSAQVFGQLARRIGPAPYGIKRIAAEEAFCTPNVIDRWRRMLQSDAPGIDPGFKAMMGFFLFADTPFTSRVIEQLTDLDERRIADMDVAGIGVQILSLTAPGVNVFPAADATAIARDTNDEMTAAIRRRPDRFAGLATVAPQDPAAAAREAERAFNELGLGGLVTNSHVNGEYLSDQKFWELFEAAEALNMPLYIHPNTPSPGMIEPFMPELYGSIMGFAAETALHLLRLIVAGVFDRFPNLKIVAGHLGEALPFWMYRIDQMHPSIVGSGDAAALERKPSEYLKENFYYTTSGMPWEPMVTMVHKLVGIDRMMYAMDYPYEYVLEEVEITDALPFSEAEMRKFYQTNAEQLFRLEIADAA